MKKLLIWDLPIRLFHWTLAAAIILAFGFALMVDKHAAVFQLHMLFGIVAAFLVLLRLLIGLFGSRHARFVNFPLSPAEAVRYFLGVLTGAAKRYAGHNPGSALAALAMFALVWAIVLTGAGGEAFEDAHEVFAYSLLGVIAAHLLGLALHTVRYRENIARSMVDGKKIVGPDEAIASSHPVWGMAFCAAALAWTFGVFSNHDAQAARVRLPIIGTVVQLGTHDDGENEKNRKGRERRREHRRTHD
jgi:cytochrome b